MTLSRKID